MNSSARRNLAFRKGIFVVALAGVGIAIFLASGSNKPWVVPEEFKRLQNPVAPTDENVRAARQVYFARCAECHGDNGEGNGRQAFRYNPAPASFQDTSHMNALTDCELFYEITEGKKPMPAFKKRLTDEQRWQLVLLVRSFAAPASHVFAFPHGSGLP
jgi:mono/diheme cytochrome c family protein